MRVVVLLGSAVCAFGCTVEVEVGVLSLEIEVPSIQEGFKKEHSVLENG